LIRALLLKASENRWLRQRGVRAPFVRRAVARFMPGESVDDMLRAATTLRSQRLDTVFTRLGENVTDLDEAQAVADHYRGAIDRIEQLGVRCEPSIKMTQLGLDIDRARAVDHARAIAAASHAAGSYLWIDMEQSAYVDVTLDIAERLRGEFPGIGVCLQAYLHRTPDDLVRMVKHGAGVRLVKGAYREPPAVAFAKKSDVDANYFALAQQMLNATDPVLPRDGEKKGSVPSRVVFGTHDTHLIARICEQARGAGIKPGAYEFHMLYGIQRAEQLRLAHAGEIVRVLIAYGSYWFPWYMRRLAERPANLWFVMRSVFAR
jgi:proline dehydrogenase